MSHSRMGEEATWYSVMLAVAQRTANELVQAMLMQPTEAVTCVCLYQPTCLYMMQVLLETALLPLRAPLH